MPPGEDPNTLQSSQTELRYGYTSCYTKTKRLSVIGQWLIDDWQSISGAKKANALFCNQDSFDPAKIVPGAINQHLLHNNNLKQKKLSIYAFNNTIAHLQG